MDLRKDDDQKKIFLLSREAITDGAMDSYHQQAQLLNRYTIAQVTRHDAVISVIRREFRKLFPDIKVDKDEILTLLDEEILKREVLESDKAKDATSKLKRAGKKLARKSSKAKKKQLPQSVKGTGSDSPQENHTE